MFCCGSTSVRVAACLPGVHDDEDVSVSFVCHLTSTLVRVAACLPGVHDDEDVSVSFVCHLTSTSVRVASCQRCVHDSDLQRVSTCCLHVSWQAQQREWHPACVGYMTVFCVCQWTSTAARTASCARRTDSCPPSARDKCVCDWPAEGIPPMPSTSA